MDIEQLRELCLSLPGATEDVKWGNDLCFCVGEKLFCVTRLEGSFAASLKVKADDFDELISTNNIIPAPYLARHKWVLIQASERLSKKEWQHYVSQSYELIKLKLPKKILDQLNLSK